MRTRTIIICILAAVFMFVFTRQSMAYEHHDLPYIHNSLKENLGEEFDYVELLIPEGTCRGGTCPGEGETIW